MELALLLRLLVLILFGSTFLISGLYRKRARIEKEIIERKEEGWLAFIMRMVAAVPLFLMILMNIFFPEWVVWSKFDLPDWISLISVILALVSVIWLWWVFHTIGGNISETVLTKESHELVTSGPYRLVRHPLYSGALFFLFSISLIFKDWVIFFYTLAGLVAFRLLVIPAEEEQLLEAFGEDYECYQSQTGAIFPWLR